MPDQPEDVYEKPVFEEQGKMDFPQRIIADKFNTDGKYCVQCSGCHGCR